MIERNKGRGCYRSGQSARPEILCTIGLRFGLDEEASPAASEAHLDLLDNKTEYNTLVLEPCFK